MSFSSNQSLNDLRSHRRRSDSPSRNMRARPGQPLAFAVAERNAARPRNSSTTASRIRPCQRARIDRGRAFPPLLPFAPPLHLALHPINMAPDSSPLFTGATVTRRPINLGGQQGSTALGGGNSHESLVERARREREGREEQRKKERAAARIQVSFGLMSYSSGGGVC